MKLVDRDKVVAEIEKVRNWFIYHNYRQSADLLDNLLVDIDKVATTNKNTLEGEIHSWVEGNTCNGYCSADIRETAEYFFELGLKAKGEWHEKDCNS